MSEAVLLALEVFFLLGSSLGMPFGERDETLVRAAPLQTILYVEWSSRGNGVPGASGPEGFVADPEVVTFRESLQTAYAGALAENLEKPEELRRIKAMLDLAGTLTSRPGCMAVYFDVPKPDPEADTIPQVDIRDTLRVSLVVNAGDEADATETAIRSFLAGSTLAAPPTGPIDHHDLVSTDPRMPLMLHRHDNYFVAGLGTGTVDKALDGLRNESQGLQGMELFTKALERVKFEKPGSIVWLNGYLFGGPSDPAADAEEPEPQLWKMLGLNPITSIVAVSETTADDTQWRGFVNIEGQPQGILGLTTGRPLKRDDFEHLPADVDFAVASSVSPQSLFGAFDAFATTLGGGSEELVRLMEETFQLSLEKDLLPAFGDVWTVHNSSADGGFVFLGPVVTLELRDRATAQAALVRFTRSVFETQPAEDEGERLEAADFLGQTIFYINWIGEPDTYFMPAFCLTDTHLVIAMHPQALKGYLRFLDSNEERFSARFDAIDSGDGERIALGWSDGKALIEALYPFVPYFAGPILGELQSGGLTLDLFAVPSMRALSSYAGPTTFAWSRAEGGLQFEGHLGVPLHLALTSIGDIFLAGILTEATTKPAPPPAANDDEAPADDAPVPDAVDPDLVPQ